VIEYPKIETLWNRDEKTFRVTPGDFRFAEAEAVKRWSVTEKIDGTNIRVLLQPDGAIKFGGRTENAQLPANLLQYLVATFTAPAMQAAFPAEQSEVLLFGEGYGAGIQKNGGGYRVTPGFRLFDVLVGEWWLEPDNVEDVAGKLNIPVAPVLFSGEMALPETVEALRELVGEASRVASEDGGKGCRPEGIVARSLPLLLTRRGHRVMWKLKYRDFTGGR
jgi:hypothetical protein